MSDLYHARASTTGSPRMNRTREVTHQEPAWRGRSDFVIGIALPEDGASEQLFARQAGPHRFEICCIPFFTYGLSLGDLVETDDDYNVTRIVERSGRRTFRVWFGDGFQPRHEIARDLGEMGALLERSSPNLLAVDAADDPITQAVVTYLDDRQEQGHVLYENSE